MSGALETLPYNIPKDYGLLLSVSTWLHNSRLQDAYKLFQPLLEACHGGIYRTPVIEEVVEQVACSFEARMVLTGSLLQSLPYGLQGDRISAAVAKLR